MIQYYKQGNKPMLSDRVSEYAQGRIPGSDDIYAVGNADKERSGGFQPGRGGRIQRLAQGSRGGLRVLLYRAGQVFQGQHGDAGKQIHVQ